MDFEKQEQDPLFEEIMKTPFDKDIIFKTLGIKVQNRVFIVINNSEFQINTIGDILKLRISQIKNIKNCGLATILYLEVFVDKLNDKVKGGRFFFGMDVDRRLSLEQLKKKKSNFEEVKWKRVCRTLNVTTSKLKVQGGWLIQLEGRNSISGFFMPDTDHEWGKSHLYYRDDLNEIELD